jgi:hypothetical protein
VVRVGAATVGPKWSPDIIRRAIRRADFSRCQTDREVPPATYRFNIDRAGVVTHAEAIDVSGQPATDVAHTCAVEVMRGLKFPVGMGPMTVSYPLR